MRATKKEWLMAICLAALLATPACLFFGPRLPEVENHPMVQLPEFPGGFDDSLCPATSGVLACPPQSALGRLGCSQIRPPGDVLAGLTPAYPLRVCLAGTPGGPELPENEYFYREGCLTAYFMRYVILKDDEYVALKSIADLQRIYAPIENDLEAFSYALAVTGLGVRYDLQAEEGLRYFVDHLEDTFVRRNAQGYQVRLFDYQICGCGPHPTSAVELLVTFDGRVEEIGREKTFEDPAEDDLCVD